MSKNDLEDLRDRAVSQFFVDFEAQGSPKDRAQYIAEEAADSLAPIHYDYIAELLALPYNGRPHFLLHRGDGKLDTLGYDADLFKAAQVVICDWLTDEILEELENRQEEEEWEEEESE